MQSEVMHRYPDYKYENHILECLLACEVHFNRLLVRVNASDVHVFGGSDPFEVSSMI